MARETFGRSPAYSWHPLPRPFACLQNYHLSSTSFSLFKERPVYSFQCFINTSHVTEYNVNGLKPIFHGSPKQLLLIRTRLHICKIDKTEDCIFIRPVLLNENIFLRHTGTFPFKPIMLSFSNCVFVCFK